MRRGGPKPRTQLRLIRGRTIDDDDDGLNKVILKIFDACMGMGNGETTTSGSWGA